MGRGRAKAKQTKVARELKYRSFDTDFNELEKELRGDEQSKASSAVDDVDDGSADPASSDGLSDDGGSRRR